MVLEHLHLHHFKNHKESNFEFGNEVNCLLGDNGSGKTNVLDAIHYLCHTKSYFNPIDGQNIAHEASHMLISGHFDRKEQQEKISCAVERGVKKIFRRNDKAYDRLADHVGLFPAVMIAPADSELVQEGSEMRRRWIDSVISQFDREYLTMLIGYNKALNQRNTLLRYFAENRRWDATALEPWDAQLVPLCVSICQKRAAFIEKFSPAFLSTYAEITKDAEAVGIEYASLVQPDEQAFAEQLRAAEGDDRKLRRTTVGIHKDDLMFMLGEHPLKRFGSQGQQKSYLIALRLTQLNYIQESTGVKPILLLDDIFDKIDDKRVESLMKWVTAGDVGQVFITDTHLGRIPEMFRETGASVRVFHVEKGVVEQNHVNSDHGAK
ncbi:MAG: DNA replication and repair protein RecF [Bacteroidetes bacterium]|nr:DNA replication and repair protein RecF [Bacteroidota bacterium]MDA1336013.1 DNA replication and repair protein RecF [Bacteroidota bacterium]